MKIIKLTTVSDRTLYVNVSHLIAFNAQDDGSTYITMTDEDDFCRVKETPEEIVKLIEFAWKV